MDTIWNGLQNVVWLFSEAAYERGRKILDEESQFVPNQHYAKLVKNYTFGGNIVAAGLLMVDDFRKAMRESLEEIKDADLFILPSIPFNRANDDLKGENFTELFKQFDVTIWMVNPEL